MRHSTIDLGSEGPRSELGESIERYLAELRVKNASPHTLRNYASDLAEFLEYFSPPGGEPPAPRAITPLDLREWLGSLYERGLDPVSSRRKLAVVRSLFRFLARSGAIENNTARLVRTPKAAKRMPIVPSAEQTNGLIDLVLGAEIDRRHKERDVLIFELLYGCGLRVSELVGLNLDDFDRSEQWIRVRGKGRKERQVPYGSKAAAALEKYLAVRSAKPGENTLMFGRQGARLSDRGAREIVKFYARVLAGEGRCIRTVFAMPMRRTYWPTARICALFRNCWATRACQPRRSTRRYR